MQRLTVRGELDSLAALREFVGAAATSAGLGKSAAYRLSLAVDEIATNIVKHGYQEAGLEGMIDVSYEIDGDRLRIHLDDTGAAYDPTPYSTAAELDQPLETRAEGGLGVFLAIRSVDDFRYVTSAGKNRHTLVVSRHEHSNGSGDTDMLSKEEIVSNLKQTRIFSGIDEEQLAEIAAKVKVATFAAGETVFSEGDPGDTMNIVAHGRVSVRKGSHVLKMLGPAEIFGEMALLDYAPRVATVSAVEDTTLLCLDKDSFFALLRERSELAIGMLRGLSQRLEQSDKAIENLQDFLEKRLLPLGAALSSEKRFDQLLTRILHEAKASCHADAGTIYLLRQERLEFTLMFCDSLGIANGPGTGSGREIAFAPLLLHDDQGRPNLGNVATRVAIEGRSINIPDIYEAEGFDFSGTHAFDQRIGYRSRSCLTAPLKNHEDQVIGVLQLINAHDPETGRVIPFGAYEQLVIQSLASQAAVALNTHLLLERQRELVIVERDVEVGRQIQSDFFPDVLPTPAGWEIDTRFQPAKEVSGDFFDAFWVKGNRVGLMVADVCDKGVGAALFMALSRSLLRAFGWLSEGCPDAADGGVASAMPSVPYMTEEPVRLTNEYIAHFHARMNMFVTLFFGLLDPSSGLLRYVNAGHNPPLLVDKNGAVKARLTATGPALGILAGSAFEVGEQIIGPGEMLLAFTDGVTEARDPQGGFFTDERLVSLVTQTPPVSASGLLDRIDAALKQYIAGRGFSDDVTMLAVRRAPASST